MQYFSFQPDLTKTYKILENTNLILSDEVDANNVQDTILKLLPGAYSILGTKVRLILVTVIIYDHIAYWDLILEYPANYYAKNLLDHIYDQTIELDDSFDHNQCGGEGIHKIYFKVG